MYVLDLCQRLILLETRSLRLEDVPLGALCRLFPCVLVFGHPEKHISATCLASVNLTTFKEVYMHLVHCWRNFSTRLSGSADTCWHFIYFMLKRKQSKRTNCFTYFLQSFGLIMLGVHYLKGNKEKERSDRTFPRHGGKPVNSH